MLIVDQIKSEIDKKFKESRGNCGIYFADLCIKINIDFEHIRPFLEQLYKEKYFIIREGLNGKMIFKKK